MLKKIFCLTFAAVVLCLTINIQSVSAADRWFYTDSDGVLYYLRQEYKEKKWRGGDVILVTDTGTSAIFFYKIEPKKPINHVDKTSYIIRIGSYQEHGQELENGSIYEDGIFAASARALYDIIYP